jgi:Domain of unknown function (DUF4129)
VAEERQRRQRTRRVVVAAGGAVALVALVAVGSLRGPLGSGRGRPGYPADLIDSLLLLLILAMVATGVLAVVSLWPDRHLARPQRGGGSWNVLLPMAAIVVLWLLRERLGLGGAGQDDAPPSTPAPPTTLEVPEPPPSSGVVPLVVAGVALAAMIGIVVAQLVAERRRRRPPPTPAERLVGLLDDTLEDLLADPDPRRAVIAAWARMERGLAAAGLPRRPSEAPFEYAARVLGASMSPIVRGTPSGFPEPLRPGSVHRLTGLFERAKFSQHAIGQADRDEAVAALRAVRRELVEAAELATQAEAAARAAGAPVTGGGDGR